MMSYVESHGLENIISWVLDGNAIMVHDQENLIHVLQLFFGQTKYRSFQRQLHMWHFDRILAGPYKGAFFHKLFLKGQKELCARMSRNVNSNSNNDGNTHPFSNDHQHRLRIMGLYHETPLVIQNLKKIQQEPTTTHNASSSNVTLSTTTTNSICNPKQHHQEEEQTKLFSSSNAGERQQNRVSFSSASECSSSGGCSGCSKSSSSSSLPSLPLLNDVLTGLPSIIDGSCDMDDIFSDMEEDNNDDVDVDVNLKNRTSESDLISSAISAARSILDYEGDLEDSCTPNITVPRNNISRNNNNNSGVSNLPWFTPTNGPINVAPPAFTVNMLQRKNSVPEHLQDGDNRASFLHKDFYNKEYILYFWPFVYGEMPKKLKWFVLLQYLASSRCFYASNLFLASNNSLLKLQS